MPLTKWEKMQQDMREQREEHARSIKQLHDSLEAERAARKAEQEALLEKYDKRWEDRLAKAAAAEEEAAMKAAEEGEESDDSDDDAEHEKPATKTKAKPKPKAPAEESGGYTCPAAGCGAPIEEDAKRCGACGTPLKW